ALVNYLNNIYKTNYFPEHITDYAVHKVLSKDVEEYNRVVEKFDKEKIGELPTIDGAKEGVAALSTRYNLVVITARPHWLEEATMEWLEDNFGDAFSCVEFSRQRHNKEFPTKAENCKKHSVIAHVEDAPHHALDIARVTNVLLMDMPYNQGIEHKNIRRVKDWGEVVDLLSK
ncbi:MAG: hypothetical protein D6769_02155, partial [Methanobacteriota archaeon]